MQGFITLEIAGENLDFQFLADNLDLSPDMICKKGEKNNVGRRIRNIVYSQDRWSVRIDFTENQMEDKFSEFLNALADKKRIFENFNSTIKKEISFYITSEMGQFGFSLSVDQIEKIKSLGVSVNFHLLSFGLVEK